MQKNRQEIHWRRPNQFTGYFEKSPENNTRFIVHADTTGVNKQIRATLDILHNDITYIPFYNVVPSQEITIFSPENMHLTSKLKVSPVVE
jgi:hypothetical protein